MGKILRWSVSLLLIAVSAATLLLVLAPPELIRVGTGYAAKSICSNHFVAGRDADEVFASDAKAPGHPLFGIMAYQIDGPIVQVGLGTPDVGTGYAVYRNGLGCTTVGKSRINEARALTFERPKIEVNSGIWPMGSSVYVSPSSRLEKVLSDSSLTGEGVRAVVVVSRERIVAERYQDGVDAQTPLLGWSMAKTVNAVIAGIAAQDGFLPLDQDQLLEDWTDSRGMLTLNNLLAMEGGLAWNEGHGDVSDVTRMLYLEPDMAQFVASKAQTDQVDSYVYSSGTSTLIARLWQDAVPVEQRFSYPYEKLFGPLDMQSAVLEADVVGTFVGSSYMYASPRDWARFGLLLLQDGAWQGRQIVSKSFVEKMWTPTSASGGVYTQAQLWTESSDNSKGVELPADTRWMRGHDGQYVAIVPSRNLVVVRMGLTPKRLGYDPALLVEAVLQALESE